jgi:hypothetical protein
MRAFEILLEVSELTKRDFYMRGRLINFINKLENQEPFATFEGESVVIPASKKEIDNLKYILKNNFDPKNLDPKAQATVPFEVPRTIGGIRLSTLQKTKEFGGKTVSAPNTEEDYTKANLGPTVEALKSFAIYAKLIIRNKDQITADDVLKIAKLANEYSKEDYSVNQKTGKKSTTLTTFVAYKREVPEITKTIKDQIALRMAISTSSFQRALRVNPKDKVAWGNLQGIVSYVNTESDIGKYSRFFSKNQKRDPVKISVMGISGAKTDISSTYTNPETGEEKPLENLSLSIKSAGASWYDQASAGNDDGMRKFYSIIGLDQQEADTAIQQAKFIGGGKKDTDTEKFAKRIKAVNQIYKITYNNLKSRVSTLDDKGEANYIQDFLKNLKTSLTGDQKLVYVAFNAKGTYEKVNPKLLFGLSKLIDLDVNYTAGSDNVPPKIFWVDKNTGKTLAFVTLLINTANYRLTHQFNLGKDFYDLYREAVKISQNPLPKDQPQPATQSVATPSINIKSKTVSTPAIATDAEKDKISI